MGVELSAGELLADIMNVDILGRRLNLTAFRVLQKECDNLGLDLFYRTYIHRMQRSFLSLVLIIQAAINISHIVLLMVNVDNSVRNAR